MKYQLMPYIYAQAKDSSERGLPMLRALFVEFPDDPGFLDVDDEYFLGSSILVAPLMHEKTRPAATCICRRATGLIIRPEKSCTGGWQRMEAGKIPAIIMVREGTVLPHIKLAQSTAQLDWTKLELVAFVKDSKTAKGLVCLPSDNQLREVSVSEQGGEMKLAKNPLVGRVTWTVRVAGER